MFLVGKYKCFLQDRVGSSLQVCVCVCGGGGERNAQNITVQKGEDSESLGIFRFKLENIFMNYI